MMEIFVQTNDGKYACYRYQGLLHYGTPEELAKQYGIPDDGYEVELDQEAAERYAKEQRRKQRRKIADGADTDHWGY